MAQLAEGADRPEEAIAFLEVALAAVQRDDATPTSFATALFAFGVSRLGTFIPISPGGLGTVDGVLAALLVSAGNSSAADALAAAGSVDGRYSLGAMQIDVLDGVAHVQAGAGIVADSVPRSEYEECVAKATAVLRAVATAAAMRTVT